MKERLEELALRSALGSFDAGDYAGFLEWMKSVDRQRRPAAKMADAHYMLAKAEACSGRWGNSENHLKEAIAIAREPMQEQRLHALRKRTPLIDDVTWAFLLSKVDPAIRLAPEQLQPEINGVWACGAYHSGWSAKTGLPWSLFLRIAKEAPPDTEDGAAALLLAGKFMARFVLEKTPLLRFVDAVAPIPANPARYERRMMSLPDELAKAVSRQLAVPLVFDALLSRAPDDLELRGLSWSERRAAIRGSLAAGSLGMATGHSLLVIDDVTTSGATLREAARVLRMAGVAAVYAVTLAHTEG